MQCFEDPIAMNVKPSFVDIQTVKEQTKVLSRYEATEWKLASVGSFRDKIRAWPRQRSHFIAVKTLSTNAL